MWIDELYARTIIAFAWASARLSDWMDRYFWDGLVRGFGAIGQLFGIFTADVDERGINVAKLKERGLQSPYLRSFVVARINPLRWIKGELPPPEKILALAAAYSSMPR